MMDEDIIDSMYNEHNRNLRKMRNNFFPTIVTPIIPEDGMEVYTYDLDGNIKYVIYDSKFMKNKANIGLFFKTSAAALLAYERFSAQQELLMLCDKSDFDLERFFTIYYSRENDEFAVDIWKNTLNNPYKFRYRQDAIDAIHKLGFRKLKLIFNIPIKD